MDIKTIRSPNRKKTISAKLCGNELLIYLPLGLSKKEEAQNIEKICKRMEKKTQKQEPDNNKLTERAKELNSRYFNGRLKINSIKYVTNQNSIFGSCSTKKGTIRISHRVAKMPQWVKDYLIIHEMAHLLHPNHSKAFWGVVTQYKYAERARGYLIAKGMEEDVSRGEL
jgi:predicted metal-dependent hydrolase